MEWLHVARLLALVVLLQLSWCPGTPVPCGLPAYTGSILGAYLSVDQNLICPSAAEAAGFVGAAGDVSALGAAGAADAAEAALGPLLSVQHAAMVHLDPIALLLTSVAALGEEA